MYEARYNRDGTKPVHKEQASFLFTLYSTEVEPGEVTRCGFHPTFTSVYLWGTQWPHLGATNFVASTIVS